MIVITNTKFPHAAVCEDFLKTSLSFQFILTVCKEIFWIESALKVIFKHTLGDFFEISMGKISWEMMVYWVTTDFGKEN